MNESDYEAAYIEAEDRVGTLQDEVAELREELDEVREQLASRTRALEDIRRDAEQALR